MSTTDHMPQGLELKMRKLDNQEILKKLSKMQVQER